MRCSRAGRRLAPAFALLALLLAAAPAQADKIDSVARQLRDGRPYKVRVSAALVLAKHNDKRAIIALARALREDEESTVRRIAALSLGSLINARLDRATQLAAFEALERASKRDRDAGVRKGATSALDRARGTMQRARAVTKPQPMRQTGRDVFVHVARATDATRQLPSNSAETVQEAVRGSLRRFAPDYQQSNATPSQAELSSRRLRGFRVGAQVAKVAVQSRGHLAEVRCTVSVRVSPWTGSDGAERLVANESASATGNGKVSSSRRDTKRAALDCAVAVTEELTARQVVPFLRRVAAAN